MLKSLGAKKIFYQCSLDALAVSLCKQMLPGRSHKQLLLWEIKITHLQILTRDYFPLLHSRNVMIQAQIQKGTLPPLEPTFSDKRNAKSPLRQHRSSTQSPIFGVPISFSFFSYKKKTKERKNVNYPVEDTAIRFQIRSWPKLNKSFNCAKQKKTGRGNAVEEQLAFVSATIGWVWEGVVDRMKICNQNLAAAEAILRHPSSVFIFSNFVFDKETKDEKVIDLCQEAQNWHGNFPTIDEILRFRIDEVIYYPCIALTPNVYAWINTIHSRFIKLVSRPFIKIDLFHFLIHLTCIMSPKL